MRQHRKMLMSSVLLLAAACMACAPRAHAAPGQALVAFGDSFSDTGLVWQALADTGQNLPFSPPYFEGRFSNGPVAVEHMARHLGMPLDGRAWGGALSGQGNILGTQAGLAESGLLAQVQRYVAEQGVQPVAAASLHVIWIGANDLIFHPSQTSAGRAVANIGQAIDALYAVGARSFFVPGMPDLSMSPLLSSVGSAGGSPYQVASRAFNAGLVEELAAARQRLPDARILDFDTPGFLQAWLDDPGAAGMVRDEACVDGTFVEVWSVCADPDAHVYWDGTHFSARVHAALGQAFAASAVPEPGGGTLMLCGLWMLAGCSRLRRRQLDAHAGAAALGALDRP